MRSFWSHVQTIEDPSGPLLFKIRASTDQANHIGHNESEKLPRMQLDTWLDHKIEAV